jgi:hypothetical protein
MKKHKEIPFRLRQFVESSHPNKDFDTLAREGQFTLEEIEGFTNKLLQEDLGVLMNKITKSSVFCVNKDFPVTKIPPLSEYFA